MSDQNTPSFAQLLRSPVLFLAFGFGSGLSPKAPGTMGTLVAVPALYALLLGPAWLYLAVCVVCALVGIWICGAASQALGVHDHGGIVWDEFAGLFVTGLPLMFWPQEGSLWLQLLLCFIWFRFFDVIKPWPIRWLDVKVHGGLGIMIDDLVAGVFAAAAVVLTFSFI